MEQIVYKFGTKERYLFLENHDPSILYWCTDTRELYRGNDLYSDGVRFVSDVNGLSVAAEGILYIDDNGNGFVYDRTNGWKQVIWGITTVIDATSTDNQVPTAKAVFDALQNIETGNIDLSDYATKSELETVSGDIATTTSKIETLETGMTDLQDVVNESCFWGEI